MVAHTRLVVAVRARVSYCVPLQAVALKHTRLVVAVRAAVSYCVPLQAVALKHTRLETRGTGAETS